MRIITLAHSDKQTTNITKEICRAEITITWQQNVRVQTNVPTSGSQLPAVIMVGGIQ